VQRCFTQWQLGKTPSKIAFTTFTKNLARIQQSGKKIEYNDDPQTHQNTEYYKGNTFFFNHSLLVFSLIIYSSNGHKA